MRYILDGYNFLFRLFDEKLESLEKQRDRVIPFLWDLFEGTSHYVEIVFDSHPAHFFSENVHRNPPFHLLFSPPPLNADQFIIELCHGIKEKKQAIVVSNDKYLIAQVKEIQIPTQSVDEFMASFRRKKRHKHKDDKPLPPFSTEKLHRYRELFEKRAQDASTFEDL